MANDLTRPIDGIENRTAQDGPQLQHVPSVTQHPNVERSKREQTGTKKSPALAGQELTFGKGRQGGVGQSPSGTRVTHHARKCSGGGKRSYKPDLIAPTVPQELYFDGGVERFSSLRWRPCGQPGAMPRQCQAHRGEKDRWTALGARARQDGQHRHHPLRNVLRTVSMYLVQALTCRACCTLFYAISRRAFTHPLIGANSATFYANAPSESIATGDAP